MPADDNSSDNDRVDQVIAMLNMVLEEKKSVFRPRPPTDHPEQAERPVARPQQIDPADPDPGVSAKIDTVKKENGRSRSEDEIRNVILQAMRNIPDFPKSGVTITVYGHRPWNAMMTFAPGSTSHANARRFRELLPSVVEKLREQFDIAI